MDAVHPLYDAIRKRNRCAVRSVHAALRIDAALAWLSERDSSHPSLIVGHSTSSAVHVVGLALARRPPEKRVAFGWHRTTLHRLATMLAMPELARAGLVPAGPATLEAVVSSVLHRLGSERLGRLSALMGRPGLPRSIARAITELRSATLGPDKLEDADLAVLLAAFETELAKRGLIDAAGILTIAAREAQQSRARSELTGIPLLLLDVVADSIASQSLLAALVERAPTVLATLPAGDERSANAFTRMLDTPLELRSEGSTPLDQLQRELFSPVSVPSVSERHTDDVTLFSAPDESRECVEIARFVHREAERGGRFDEMAVVLRTLDPYRAYLEQALRRAGIPAFMACGRYRPEPSGRALLTLLSCAREKLSVRRFAEYLSLGQDPFTDRGSQEADNAPQSESAWCADRHGTRLWESLLEQACVIAGRERWERRLDWLAVEKERELATLPDPSQAAGHRIRAEIRALSSLRSHGLALIRCLEPLCDLRAPWGEWLERLGDLSRRAISNPDPVLSILAELSPMADVGDVDLVDVRCVLEPRIVNVLPDPDQNRFGRLFVGAVDDVRGLSFDVVFLPGMAERLFPQKVTEDPVLPDRQRRAHASLLVTNADRTAGERLMLRLAVGAARRRIVVSFPRIDAEQSRPRTPSFYALEVLRAAEGELPGFVELARRAERVGHARLGWPAPATPHEAIDAAEHDLSLLESILHRPEHETVGMARYLLGCNPHLARALRFRARRWIRAWTKADGLVDPAEEAKEALAAHALSARSYSPTALQNFATCPYRFVLQAIHKIAPRERPSPLEELDPLGRGSLIHEVQYEFLSELRREGALPLSPADLDAALGRLATVLDRVAERYRETLAPAIERVWRDSIDAIRADLTEWLRRMSRETDWCPVHFELSFGLPGRRDQDPRSEDAPVVLDCGIRLRGSIDLVERSTRGTLRATDHKSGKTRCEDGTLIGGGEVLQPVLYALALEKIFRETTIESGRLYYCTVVGQYSDVTVPLSPEARRAADEVARTIDQSLTAGFLPAAPAPGACEYCDYALLCGPYEELRATKIKRQDSLKALAQLRACR